MRVASHGLLFSATIFSDRPARPCQRPASSTSGLRRKRRTSNGTRHGLIEGSSVSAVNSSVSRMVLRISVLWSMYSSSPARTEGRPSGRVVELAWVPVHTDTTSCSGEYGWNCGASTARSGGHHGSTGPWKPHPDRRRTWRGFQRTVLCQGDLQRTGDLFRAWSVRRTDSRDGDTDVHGGRWLALNRSDCRKIWRQ